MLRSLVCVFLTRHVGARRREFVYAVKNCRDIEFGNFRGRDGRELAIELAGQRRAMMFDYLRDAILVPVPTSGAGVDEPGDDLWSGRDLARMLAQEYGVEFRELLRRRVAIDKSSSGTVARNLRRHVESIELVGPAPRRPVVLVDDFVASGSTLCGCAEVLLRSAPDLAVKGFAVAYSPAPEGGPNEALVDFATREYEWNGLDSRPRNWPIPSALSKR